MPASIPPNYSDSFVGTYVDGSPYSRSRARKKFSDGSVFYLSAPWCTVQLSAVLRVKVKNKLLAPSAS